MRITFGYKAGSGKDNAMAYIKSRYPGKYISFASPRYQILYFAQDQLGWSREKDRKFLQWVGTEWGREREPNVWVCLALESVPSEGFNC